MVRFFIRKCPRCGAYTLKEICPKCGSDTVVASPPRFSPLDRYVKYRVMAKEGVQTEAEKTADRDTPRRNSSAYNSLCASRVW